MFSVDAKTPREKINLLGQVLDSAVGYENPIGKSIFEVHKVWRSLPNLASKPRPTFGEYLAEYGNSFDTAVVELLNCTGVHLPMNTGLGEMVATRDIAFATSFLLDYNASAKQTRADYRKSRKDTTRFDLIGIEDTENVQLRQAV